MFYGSERSPQDIWASVYCLALSELVWIEEEACMTSSWWPGIVGNGKTGPTAHLTQMCANPATPGFPIPGTPEWTAKIALLKRISWDTLGRNPDTQIVSCYTSHTEASLCQPLPVEHWRPFSNYQKYSQEIHPSFEKGRKRGSQLTRKECSWQKA